MSVTKTNAVGSLYYQPSERTNDPFHSSTFKIDFTPYVILFYITGTLIRTPVVKLGTLSSLDESMDDDERDRIEPGPRTPFTVGKTNV